MQSTDGKPSSTGALEALAEDLATAPFTAVPAPTPPTGAPPTPTPSQPEPSCTLIPTSLAAGDAELTGNGELAGDEGDVGHVEDGGRAGDVGNTGDGKSLEDVVPDVGDDEDDYAYVEHAADDHAYAEGVADDYTPAAESHDEPAGDAVPAERTGDVTPAQSSEPTPESPSEPTAESPAEPSGESAERTGDVTPADPPTAEPPEPVESPDAPAPLAPRFERDRERARRRRRRHIACVSAAVLVGTLAAAYVIGAVVFTFVYYPNTTIMGADVSLMTADSAAAEVELVADGYTLSVTGDGLHWEVTASELDLEIDSAEVASDAISSNEPLTWPVRVWRALATDEGATDYAPADGTYPVTYDEEALLDEARKAAEAHSVGRSGTFDVDSAFDADSGTFTMAALDSNRHLSARGLAAVADSGLMALATQVETDRSAYKKLVGGGTRKQMRKALRRANKMVSADVKLVMGGSVVAHLDSETTVEWLSFSEDLTPQLDDTLLAKWATQLAGTLSTVGTERTFKGSAGGKVTVSGGNWGWEVDAEELTAVVRSAVAEGTTGRVSVPTTSEADVYNGAGKRDWGAYAEVDIGEQYAWLYDEDGNVVWESGVITGNPYRGNSTPTGVYYINNKLMNITLRGDNYASRVTFWMAIVGGSVGFHDATWQYSGNFGRAGAQYSVGSHGCVNLPYDAAEELYDLIEVGTCVVIHD